MEYKPKTPEVSLLIATRLLNLSMTPQAMEMLSGNKSSSGTYLKVIAARNQNNSVLEKKLSSSLLTEIDGDNAKMYKIAKLADSCKDRVLALRLFKRIAKSTERSIDTLNARMNLAEVFEKSGKYVKALGLYKKAYSYARGRKLRVKSESLDKYIKSKLALLNNILRGGSDSWRLAVEAFEEKEYALAVKRFDAFTMRNPAFALAYYNKALALEKLNRLKEAVDELDIALSVPDGKTREFRVRCVLNASQF